VERSGASAYPSSGKPVTENTHTPPIVVKAPPSAALSAAPRSRLPCFQLGNIGIVEMPGAVDATANLVDVRGETADE